MKGNRMAGGVETPMNLLIRQLLQKRENVPVGVTVGMDDKGDW
jgi:hypothetical protein